MARTVRSFTLAMTFASMGLLHQASMAAPKHIECPAEVPEATILLVTTDNGWKPYKSFPLRLNSAAPTGGPPELNADLAQFTTKRKKTERIDTYDLSPPHPGGLWIKCGYGASNEITLHKQLDDSITQCTITQKNASPSKIEIVCK
jgi:hypothetical protein